MFEKSGEVGEARGSSAANTALPISATIQATESQNGASNAGPNAARPTPRTAM